MNNNKTTQIEIGGIKYEVNLEQAIEQGLIKPVKYYRIGQKFYLEDKICKTKVKHMLCAIAMRRIMLISLDDGNRFSDQVVNIHDVNRITQEEFDRISPALKQYIAQGEARADNATPPQGKTL